MINEFTISIKAYHARAGEQKAGLSMARARRLRPRPLTVLALAVFGLIAFPAIYRMAAIDTRTLLAGNTLMPN